MTGDDRSGECSKGDPERVDDPEGGLLAQGDKLWIGNITCVALMGSPTSSSPGMMGPLTVCFVLLLDNVLVNGLCRFTLDSPITSTTVDSVEQDGC